MSPTLRRSAFALAVFCLLGTCERSPDLCYEDGVLECDAALPMEPGGSEACQDQYVLGYTEECGTTLTTVPATTITTITTIE